MCEAVLILSTDQFRKRMKDGPPDIMMFQAKYCVTNFIRQSYLIVLSCARLSMCRARGTYVSSSLRCLTGIHDSLHLLINMWFLQQPPFLLIPVTVIMCDWVVQ